MVASDVLDTLLAGYTAVPQDATAKKLVDESELWFIPMGNPYGNAHNQRANASGVDLNRNFWGPAGSDVPPAFSQKETQAIRDLTETATADHAKKRFTVSLSFHEGEVCFNSVWNYTTAPPTDEPVFWTSRSGGNVTLAPDGLAKAYQDGCTSPGFWYTNGADWYVTRGDTNDWSYGAWTSLDTTIELNTTKAPPASQIPAYCGQHRQAVLNYMLKAFQGIHGVMTDQTSGAPLDGTVTATCTASAGVSVPHPYQAVYTDPAAGDFHRVLQPGTYTVTCKASGYPDTVIPGVVVTADTRTACNCPMGTPCAGNPTSVDVTPAGPLVLYPGTGQTLAANVTGGTGPFTYQWYDGATAIPGAQAPTYLANDAGVHSYTCKVTGGGCAGGVPDPTPTQITWQSTPLAFHPLTPCRVIDTRGATGTLGGPVLAPGVSVRTFPVTGSCGIPATAKALSVNQTVTAPAVAGFIRVYPGDLTGALIPITSAVAFPAGRTRANNAILALSLDGSGTIAVENDAVGGTVHFILDVNGYFE